MQLRAVFILGEKENSQMRLTAAERAVIRKVTRAGGRKRMRLLSPEQRTALAVKAATIRWANFHAGKAAQGEAR